LNSKSEITSISHLHRDVIVSNFKQKNRETSQEATRLRCKWQPSYLDETCGFPSLPRNRFGFVTLLKYAQLLLKYLCSCFQWNRNPTNFIIITFSEIFFKLLLHKDIYPATILYMEGMPYNYSGSFLSLFSSPNFSICPGNSFWKINMSHAHIQRSAPSCQLTNGNPIRRTRRITAKNFLVLWDITYAIAFKTDKHNDRQIIYSLNNSVNFSAL